MNILWNRRATAWSNYNFICQKIFFVSLSLYLPPLYPYLPSSLLFFYPFLSHLLCFACQMFFLYTFYTCRHKLTPSYPKYVEKVVVRVVVARLTFGYKMFFVAVYMHRCRYKQTMYPKMNEVVHWHPIVVCTVFLFLPSSTGSVLPSTTFPYLSRSFVAGRKFIYKYLQSSQRQGVVES